MIENRDGYLNFIEHNGVASRNSRNQYISYLNCVSKLIGKDISPETLKSEDDISNIKLQLEEKCIDIKTISNYSSAMSQYVALVNANGSSLKLGYVMKPWLISESSDDKILKSIVECISDIECSGFFSNHHWKSLSQKEKKKIVTEFQALVIKKLTDAIPSIKWSMEHVPSSGLKDAIDIYGEGNGIRVVIELDAHRADQVAKKFVSRTALLPSSVIYFISLCYPGTKRMNQKESGKYFGYCSEIATRLGNHYAGFIIGK